jgi:Ca-activated chloride channel family protein
MTLDDVYVGIIPRGGTAIAQALDTALDSFEKEGEADRAILLITDGEDHEGNVAEATAKLKERGIRVFAVGLGSTEGELIPAEEDGGRTGFLKDKGGSVVKSSLREDVLEKLALSTGGMYVRAAPGDIGVERILDQGLSKLTRKESDSKMMKAYEERFYWPLAVAFALLAVEAAIPERRRLKAGEAA